MTTYLILAVEDELSASVMQRLIQETGRDFAIYQTINARGYGKLKSGMKRFKNACRALPHVILTDLDQYACPPELLKDWKALRLPQNLLLRIAVREVESWLLADRKGISDFLSVASNMVPQQPENDADPKRTLINLARKSRKRHLAAELVPERGSCAPIGALYNVRLSEYVGSRWNVQHARTAAPSLDRAFTRLTSFMPEV